MNTTTRDTLNRIASLLAAHPELPPPYIALYDHTPHTADLHWYLHINNKGGADEQRQTAQTIVRTIGGAWEKDYGTNYVDFTQERDGLSLSISVVREAVCVRRVVGAEVVTIPATEAQGAQPERTETREIVEWDCQPFLAEAESVSA